MQSNKSLTDKLEQYSTTTRGQGIRGKSAAEWAGYAAAAGASLAMAGAADASIIYSGVRNVTVQVDPSIQTVAPFFQVDSAASFTVGGSLFMAQAAFQIYDAAGTFSKYGGGAGLFVASGGAQILGTGGSLGGSFLAASNADIGPGGIFANGSAGLLRQNRVGSITVNNTFGNFPLGATGIIGAKLASGNYAWIRLKIEDLGLNQPLRDYFGLTGGFPLNNGQNYADKITVIDWAYEDSGAAIHAGATSSPVGVPEPSALALLAAGAAGIGAFRRRKAERTVH